MRGFRYGIYDDDFGLRMFLREDSLKGKLYDRCLEVLTFNKRGIANKAGDHDAINNAMLMMWAGVASDPVNVPDQTSRSFSVMSEEPNLLSASGRRSS